MKHAAATENVHYGYSGYRFCRALLERLRLELHHYAELPPYKMPPSQCHLFKTHIKMLLVTCLPKLFSDMTFIICKAWLTGNCICSGQTSLSNSQPWATAPRGFGANLLLRSIFSCVEGVIIHFPKKFIKKTHIHKEIRLLSLSDFHKGKLHNQTGKKPKGIL